MAIDARRGLEDMASLGHGLVYMGGLALLMDPAVEILSRLNIYAEEHLRVLHATVLSALSQINSGLARIYPGFVLAVRYQIRFPRQARHPKAVVRVGGEQVDESGARLGWIADGNVQFIRSDYAQIGIP